MERTIEAEPSYTPLIQKPMCCSSACVQMIMLRHGINPPLQDEIAKETGVTISKEKADCFMESLVVLEKPYGIETATKKTESKINTFFEKKGFPFKVKAFRVSEIEDHRIFIVDNLDEGNDIHVEVCMKNITGNENCHDMILSKINLETNKVTLIDPWWTNKQYHDIDLRVLIDSMDKKWFNRELGFLIYYKR
jgi:hypothetical protein